MPAHRPLIAVVDDDQSVRKALNRLIRTEGFEVRVFSSGDAFLSSLPQGKPDGLVLDLHMPGSDGFEVLAALTKVAPELPVIIITASDTPQNRTRALELGAQTYLRKPLDDSALLDALNAAVRR